VISARRANLEDAARALPIDDRRQRAGAVDRHRIRDVEIRARVVGVRHARRNVPVGADRVLVAAAFASWMAARRLQPADHRAGSVDHGVGAVDRVFTVNVAPWATAPIVDAARMTSALFPGLRRLRTADRTVKRVTRGSPIGTRTAPARSKPPYANGPPRGCTS
jgi:hypothetical protein